MANIAFVIFVLAVVLLTVGVLIGSGLHTRAVDRRYRRVAQLVRELHEREEALAKREKALARSSGPHVTYQEDLTEATRVDVASS